MGCRCWWMGCVFRYCFERFNGNGLLKGSWFGHKSLLLHFVIQPSSLTSCFISILQFSENLVILRFKTNSVLQFAKIFTDYNLKTFKILLSYFKNKFYTYALDAAILTYYQLNWRGFPVKKYQIPTLTLFLIHNIFKI